MPKRKEIDIKEEVAIEEEEPIEDDIIHCKTVYFCYGKNQIIHFKNANKSIYINAIPSNSITYCITDCNHENENELFTKLKMPLIDIQIFLYLCQEEPPILNKLKESYFHCLSINYQNIIYLLDMFLMNKQYEEDLKKWLKETITIFNYSQSALSAFCLTKFQKQETNNYIFDHPLLIPLIDIAYNLDFPLITRLKYLICHYATDFIIETKLMMKLDVSQTLGILPQLLEFLSEDECIIAGGAALKLGCPKSRFTLKCDVDFFILHGPKQKLLIEQMLDVLQKNNYHIFIYNKSESCFSAIGTYGMRRIQLIASIRTKAFDIIHDFDLPAVRAYYDGTLFHVTAGALHDWITMECTTYTFYNIKAKRLFGLSWKGFKLDENAIQFLQNTIPDLKTYEKQYENNIPFITNGIPIEVQYANIYSQYHLSPFIKEELKNEETKTELFTLERYGIAMNIYCGVLENYSNFCKVELSTASRKFDACDKIPLIFHDIQYDYLIQLNCLVSSNTGQDGLLFHNLDKEDLLFKKIPALLFEKLMKLPNAPELPIRKLVINCEENFISITKQSRLFANGIQVSEFPKKKSLFARTLIRPLYLYERKYQIGDKESIIKLRWNVAQVYWTI